MLVSRVDHLGRTFPSSSCAGCAFYKVGEQHARVFEFKRPMLNAVSHHDPYHATPYEWAMFAGGGLGKIDDALLCSLEQYGASIFSRELVYDSPQLFPFGSILHIAVGRGDFEAVQHALTQNTRFCRASRNKDGWLKQLDTNQRTPLHYIAMLRWYPNETGIKPEKLLDIAKTLVQELGDSIGEELNRPDKFGLTPYLLAKKYGNVDIYHLFKGVITKNKIIIKIPNLNFKLHYTQEEMRYLSHTFQFEQSHLSEDFLETLPNPFGLRPLHIALKQNNLTAFCKHLDRFSYIQMALLHEKDEITGDTGFLLAAAYLDTLEKAVDHMQHMDIVDLGQTNKLGQNALHLAVTHLQVDNVKFLLKTLPKKCVWVADFLGRTPLHLASLLMPIERGYQPMKQEGFLSKQAEIVALLLEAGASLEALDRFNKLPRDYAIETQSRESTLAKVLWPKEDLGFVSKAFSYCYDWWSANKPALPSTSAGLPAVVPKTSTVKLNV